MRSALVIARRILRQRLRDRSAILFAVLTPLGLAVAFAAIIPDFSPTFHTTIVVVDQDGGQLAGILRDDVLGTLVERGIADVTPATDEAAATAEIDADRAGAAIVIPAGLHRRGRRGQPAELRDPRRRATSTAREVARAVVVRVRRRRRGRPARGPDDRRDRRPGRSRRRSTRPRRPSPRLEPRSPSREPGRRRAPGVDGDVLRRGDGHHVRLLRDPVRRARTARRAARRHARTGCSPRPSRRRRSSSAGRSRGWSWGSSR